MSERRSPRLLNMGFLWKKVPLPGKTNRAVDLSACRSVSVAVSKVLLLIDLTMLSLICAAEPRWKFRGQDCSCVVIGKTSDLLAIEEISISRPPLSTDTSVMMSFHVMVAVALLEKNTPFRSMNCCTEILNPASEKEMDGILTQSPPQCQSYGYLTSFSLLLIRWLWQYSFRKYNSWRFQCRLGKSHSIVSKSWLSSFVHFVDT